MPTISAPPHLQITLRDGRTLGYSQFGAENGWPVINNHGGLVCRLDIAPAHDTARQLGIRIISPDRPGVALSDPKTARTVLDWASDVEELLDQLKLERVSVLGWSMGGPYALACAWALQKRVSRTAVVAGVLALDDPKHLSELNLMDRRLTEMAHHHPENAKAAFVILGEIASKLPHLWNGIAGRGLAARDIETIHNLPDPGLAGMAAPALLSAQGMVEEYRAWARPWGFAPEQVSGQVDIWQGVDDHLVPPAWGKELASRMPTAGLELLPGEGHMLAYNNYPEILKQLKP